MLFCTCLIPQFMVWMNRIGRHYIVEHQSVWHLPKWIGWMWAGFVCFLCASGWRIQEWDLILSWYKWLEDYTGVHLIQENDFVVFSKSTFDDSKSFMETSNPTLHRPRRRKDGETCVWKYIFPLNWWTFNSHFTCLSYLFRQVLFNSFT